MKNKLTAIFQKTKYESSPQLAESVWRAIVVRDQWKNKIKLWIFTLIGFLSLAGLVPAFAVLSNDLAKSGFYEYFSLIFSDSGLVASFSKELIFSLAESLPVMNIVLSLTLLFVFFLSIKYVMKQIIRLARNATHSVAGGNQLTF